MFTESIGILKMKTIEVTGIDFLELRQLLDHISLFKHSMCLSSVTMTSIVHDKAMYKVEYVIIEDTKCEVA